MTAKFGLIVVPVYNEADSLQRVGQQLAHRDPRCDLLFVNDGSSDDSGQLLQAAGHDVVHHPVNLGYLEALRTGMSVALSEGYEFVVFFDADGQHQVQDLGKMVEHHLRHPEHDIVIGSRYLGRQRAATWLRHLVSRCFALCVRWATGEPVNDVTSGLKLLTRRAMQTASGFALEDGHAEFLMYMGRKGCRIAEVPIHVEPRREGTSMYHLSKALRYLPKTVFLMLLATLTRRSF